jgi:hypothetical protein
MIITALVTVVLWILSAIAGYFPDIGINDVAMGDTMVSAVSGIFITLRWANFWFPVDFLQQIILGIIQLEIVGYFVWGILLVVKFIRGSG